MATLLRWLWFLLPGNPLLVRVVQGGSRRSRHQWVRMGYLGALVAMVTIGLLAGGGMHENVTLTDLAKAGAQIFTMISYGQVLLICLLAPLFMAGAIGQEKVGRTYDILLTTPLSSLQIVLGSLGGRLFFVLALLASGLPLFAVLLIFGGVPIRAVFVSFGVAGLSACAVGSVAVALSVVRSGGRQAVYWFIILTGAYLVATYTLDRFVLRQMAPVVAGLGGLGTTWLTPLHPLLVLEASLNSVTYRAPSLDELGAYPGWARFYLSRPFATFALLSGCVSVVLTVWSAVALRRIGRRQGRVSWVSGLVQRLKLGLGFRGAGGGGAQLRRRRPRGVWANPVAWREAQTRSNRVGGVLGRLGSVVLSVGAIGLLLWAYHRGVLPTIPDPLQAGTLGPHEVLRLGLQAMLLVQLAVIVLVAIYLSAGCVSREREEGTLDLILMTPVTARQFIWGKLRGLVSFLVVLLLAPVLTLGVVSVYTLIGQGVGWPGAVVPAGLGGGGVLGPVSVDLVLPESPLLLAGMLVPFVALCVMVGMVWSLKSTGVLGAVVPAVGIVGCLVAVTGVCGYGAAQNLPLVGPVLGALSPVTHTMLLLDPWQRVVGFGADPVWDRVGLAVSAVIAGGCYGLVVYLIQLTLVKDFDQTVRRLSGSG